MGIFNFQRVRCFTFFSLLFSYILQFMGRVGGGFRLWKIAKQLDRYIDDVRRHGLLLGLFSSPFHNPQPTLLRKKVARKVSHLYNLPTPPLYAASFFFPFPPRCLVFSLPLSHTLIFGTYPHFKSPPRGLAISSTCSPTLVKG